MPSATPARSARPARGRSSSKGSTTPSSTRLAEAARSIVVGPPEDPETVVGPVIDADAKARVLRYGALARREGRVVFAGDVGTARREGPLRRPDDRRRRRPIRPDRPGRDLRPDPRRDPGQGPRRRPGDRQRHRVRPDRRPLLAEPGQHREGQASSSVSATSTSIARSPGPSSTASRSAASSSQGSADPRPADRTTSTNSCSPEPSPRTRCGGASPPRTPSRPRKSPPPRNERGVASLARSSFIPPCDDSSPVGRRWGRRIGPSSELRSARNP